VKNYGFRVSLTKGSKSKSGGTLPVLLFLLMSYIRAIFFFDVSNVANKNLVTIFLVR
jgi:hypothetical protein